MEALRKEIASLREKDAGHSAEVSEMEAVQAARAKYEVAVKAERLFI